MRRVVCQCGHGYAKHLKEVYPHYADIYNPEGQNECYARSKKHPDILCACLNYAPDNLGYIEKLAKKKGLL